MTRFWIMNIAAAAVLGALSWAGALTALFHGPGAPGAIAISLLTVIALGTHVLYAVGDQDGDGNRYWWALEITAFIRTHLTTVGLIGTVIGLMIAMTGATFEGDAATVMASLAGGIGLALGSTISGLVGYLWLETVEKFT